MPTRPTRTRDPIGWNAAVALAFLALASVRLTIPSTPFFDEIHYLPAARALLEVSGLRNIEHPPLGKQLLALGMAAFGDNALGWRIMPLLFGTLALFAGMRAMWFASCSRAASMLTGFYLATGFPLIVQARIAMLDIFMAAFVLGALWMCAGAVREAETARWRLAAAGAMLGAAVACKWNAAPMAALPGLAFVVLRLWSVRRGALTSRRGPPVPGMTLGEASVWLGLLPLAVYAASYWPFALDTRIEPAFARSYLGGLLALHEHMLELQTQLKTPHPYQSMWADWVINRRAIWYLYEHVDGAQRGVLLVGNPLTMLAGLGALAWCAWVGFRAPGGATGGSGSGSGTTAAAARAGAASDSEGAGTIGRRWEELAVVLLYGVSLAMWIIAPKPVQFYYHYLLPSCFLLAALALATERLWQRGARFVPGTLVTGAAGLFVYFHPILTAAALSGEQAFLGWAWLEGWR